MKSEPKAFASLSSGLLARKGAARPAMRPQGFGQSGNGLDDLGWNDMGYDATRPTLAAVDGQGLDEADAPVSRSPLVGLTPASPVHHQQAEIEERLHGADQDEFCEAEEGEAFEEEARIDEDDALELSDELPEAMPVRSPAAVLVPMLAPITEPDEPTAFEPQEFRAPVPVREEAAPELLVPPAPPKPRRGQRAEAAGKGKAAFTLRLDPSRHLKLRLACAVNAKSAQQLVTKALDELLASMPELDAMASKAPESAKGKG